jgi:PAS domain S-box-containing protein
MEMANITYMDEQGNIKVKIDHEKCIVCGFCISACQHDVRRFDDDTERFFEDLAKGVPISLMAAPAIKSNIPQHKKIFTYLKRLGVNKIYDVSLGADICIWAHIKHMENSSEPFITQPCPPIVTYCEIYRNDLLKRLSPVHSPMACTAVYMKKTQNISDKIAALSPCMAKKTEFASTGLVDYNITFAKLLAYINKKEVTLPEQETEFDSGEAALGSLFPIPGGFKENIEFLTGKRLHIAKAEGSNVYDKLNKYADVPEDFLPDIYDVLSCSEGCNLGSASLHDRCAFEMEKVLRLDENSVTEEHKREYYKRVYKTYGEVLNPAHFKREYKPARTPFPQITDADIARSFELLLKDSYEKQHVDCYACGSKTCQDMARKIALNVNIPENCIVKSKEDAKLEHEKNMLAHEQLIKMEKVHEMDERVRILFDSTPFAAHFWDENLSMTDCNEAAAKMFNLTKQEYVRRYFEFMPELQPCGTPSDFFLREVIKKTFETGYLKTELMCLTLEGEPLPLEDTYVCVEFKGEKLVAGYSRDLREHKKIMLELEDSAEEIKLQLVKLDMVIKATKIALWDMRTNRSDPAKPTNIITYSDDFRNLIGYENQDDFPNVVASWSDKLHPEDKERSVNAFNAHVLDKTGKTPFDIEYRLLKKNGEYAWFRAAGKTVRDEKGNPIHIAGALIDITEAKNLINEKELQLAKLDLALRNENIGLWEMEYIEGDPLNPENTVIWSNEIRQMLGYEGEHDFPNKISSFINSADAEDWDLVRERLGAHITDKTGQTQFDVEYKLRHKDGSYVYFHASSETIRDEDGNALYVAGALNDITKMKNLVAESEAAAKAMELQLIKLNLAIEAGNIGVWDMEVNMEDPVGPDNNITWSDEFRRMLGYNDTIEFPNKNKSIIKALHPEDLDVIPTALSAHILDKTGQTPFNVEYRVIRKNGELAYIRATGGTLRDIEGNPIHAAGAIFDMTDIKNAINEADRQRTEAEAANKAKSEFLSHISHEIRTPMNAVLGTAEFQLQKETNHPDTEEAFGIIFNSGNLLLNIINDILDLSKIEAGKLEIFPAAYDVPSIINDTMQLNLLRYESKSIDFDLKLDENTPLDMFGDELRIKQVLNNILSNAFKYTEKGGVELSVWAETDDSTDDDNDVMLALKISDTGQGMTEEQISKLFDEYTRFVKDANRTTVGTGLGMSITRRLVDAMAGELDVQSTPGKGSVFTVRLPQKRLSADVCGAEIADNLLNNRFRNSLKMKRVQIVHEYMPYGSVLVVDDIDSNLYVAKGMMMPYGLKIDTASNGYEAVEKIKNGNVYDIVFMDHMMPKMDGLEATELIRSHGYKHPIVALTANAITGSSEMFLSRGFDGYVSKPIDLRELNASLNRLIRDKQPPEVLEDARKRQLSSMKAQLIDSELSAAVALDIKSALVVLKDLLGAGQLDFTLFTTTAHGLKSALANINETALSVHALKLEKAGAEADLETIKAETPTFINALRALLKQLTPKSAKAGNEKIIGGAEEFLRQKLDEIAVACKSYKKRDAKAALDELKAKRWQKKTMELLEAIAENLLCGEFEEIIKSVEDFNGVNHHLELSAPQ